MNKKDKYFYEYPEHKNVREMIYYAVEKNANSIAFTIKEKINDKDKSDKKVKYKNITFAEMLEDINNLGAALFNLGMKEKRIAIISKNRYEWTLGYMAATMGNMVAVPLDRALTEVELENSLVRSKADAIIFEDGCLEMIKNIRANGKTNLKEYICMDNNEEFKNIYDIIKTGKKLLEEGKKDYLNVKIDCEKMSILLFTSGTTADSKAVMLSHKNIVHNVVALSRVVKITNSDVYLALLPLHHSLGTISFLFLSSNGAKTVFCDGLRYVKDNLKEYKVSIVVTVPLLVESMDKKINQEINKKGKTKTVAFAKKLGKFLNIFGIDIRRKLFKEIIDQFGGDLRYLVSGAAPLDKKIIRSFNEMGIRTIQGYGLTETAPVIAMGNDRYSKDGSTGFPLLGVEAKTINNDENGVGELLVKGPNVMLGYYEDEEATKAVIKDGWINTGDLVRIDKDGYLFVTGRKKNVIVLKNGKNIYPEELETLINKLEIVKDSMVFGTPKCDDLIVSVKIQYNEEVAKEKYPDANEDRLRNIVWDQIKEINKTLPQYKYIKNMILTKEEFIKTTTAKIKRHEELEKFKKS